MGLDWLRLDWAGPGQPASPIQTFLDQTPRRARTELQKMTFTAQASRSSSHQYQLQLLPLCAITTIIKVNKINASSPAGFVLIHAQFA
jgi:hypothetical protein